MDYGFVFFGSVQIPPVVALAEKRGFTHAWLYDSQMLASDVYAALALCASNTKKIFLGPGVTNPASRIAPLTACSIASINALAPGRTILGMALAIPLGVRWECLRHDLRCCEKCCVCVVTSWREKRRRIKKVNGGG